MKTPNHILKAEALQAYFQAYKNLESLGILINKKDFTCQLGEWFIETIYDGQRALNGIQKGWDVRIGEQNIQVKTHAKAVGNNNRWSAVEKYSSEKIDELIIVVFSSDYKLKTIFKAPWGAVEQHIRERGLKKPRYELSWSMLESFEVPLDLLPKQEIVNLFR